jgi:uroporphyrinogen-III synthase
VHVLITRPRADAAALAEDLAARGHRVTIEPLLAIEPEAGVVPALAGVQAIVLTSAHAVPALPASGVDLPAFAVGDATARAARERGCGEVHTAAGDAASLARLIAERCRPAAGPLLHLAGAEVRPGLAEALVAAGFALRRQTVYRAVAARRLSAPLIAAIRSRSVDAALLFSPRSATILVDLIIGHELSGCLGRTEAICLSAAVAVPCRRLSWRAVRVAPRPEVGSLLGQLEGGGRRC